MSVNETHATFFFVIREDVKIDELEEPLIKFSQTVAGKNGFVLVKHQVIEEFVEGAENIGIYIREQVGYSTEAEATAIDFTFWQNRSPDSDITLVIETIHRWVLIRGNYSFFMRNNSIWHFLDFCKAFYQIFGPLYGYGITEMTDYPDEVKLTAEKIEILYTYNFFGPDMVSEYQRNVLKMLPSWQVEHLSDGGMFIAMEFNPYRGEENISNYKDAIKMLGVAQFRRGEIRI